MPDEVDVAAAEVSSLFALIILLSDDDFTNRSVGIDFLHKIYFWIESKSIEKKKSKYLSSDFEDSVDFLPSAGGGLVDVFVDLVCKNYFCLRKNENEKNLQILPLDHLSKLTKTMTAIRSCAHPIVPTMIDAIRLLNFMLEYRNIEIWFCCFFVVLFCYVRLNQFANSSTYCFAMI